MSRAPILVTGAAGGIGAAICRQLAEDGHRVIGTDITAPRAGDCSRFVEARLPEEAGQLIAALPERLSGLVFAAGTIATSHPDAFDPDAFDRIFSINVRAPIELTARLCGRLEAPASVVFVGSVAGLRASPGHLLYGASKAALHNAALSFARALAPRGIRVNAVAPGLIDTALTARTDEDIARLEGSEAGAVASRRRQAIPLGRIGTPDDVAALVRFLVSEASGFVTGEVYRLDGGSSL